MFQKRYCLKRKWESLWGACPRTDPEEKFREGQNCLILYKCCIFSILNEIMFSFNNNQSNRYLIILITNNIILVIENINVNIETTQIKDKM